MSCPLISFAWTLLSAASALARSFSDNLRPPCGVALPETVEKAEPNESERLRDFMTCKGVSSIEVLDVPAHQWEWVGRLIIFVISERSPACTSQQKLRKCPFFNSLFAPM